MTTEEQKRLEDGFKQGYLLAEYEPEMAELLASATGESTYLKGLQAGKERFDVEQTKDRLPSWLTRDRFKKDGATPDKSKDKDIEPEL